MNQAEREQQIQLFRGHDAPLTPYQQAQLARQHLDYRRAESAANFSRLVLLIGLAFGGGFGLLIGGSILAAATRPVPPPAPVTINRCLLFCGGQ